MFGTSSWVG